MLNFQSRARKHHQGGGRHAGNCVCGPRYFTKKSKLFGIILNFQLSGVMMYSKHFFVFLFRSPLPNGRIQPHHHHCHLHLRRGKHKEQLAMVNLNLFSSFFNCMRNALFFPNIKGPTPTTPPPVLRRPSPTPATSSARRTRRPETNPVRIPPGRPGSPGTGDTGTPQRPHTSARTVRKKYFFLFRWKTSCLAALLAGQPVDLPRSNRPIEKYLNIFF